MKRYESAHTDLYAHFRDGYWWHLYPSKVALRMCSVPEEDMKRVRVSYDENGAYWGWWDAEKEHFTMIWPSRVQVEICFPYGSAAEERRGRGKLVQLKVEEIQELSNDPQSPNDL